ARADRHVDLLPGGVAGGPGVDLGLDRGRIGRPGIQRDRHLPGADGAHRLAPQCGLLDGKAQRRLGTLRTVDTHNDMAHDLPLLATRARCRSMPAGARRRTGSWTDGDYDEALTPASLD